MSDELNVLKAVTQRLNQASISYMISGSMAMNYYAQPRMTRDIDIVIVLTPNDVKRFVSLFEKDFYIDSETVQNEVKRSGMFNLIHNEHIVKVDFMILKDEEFDRTEFDRRKRIEIDKIPMWMISPEDLILYKCLWAKDSASEMQIRDIRNLMEMVSDLDVEYIRAWIAKLRLGNFFKEVMGEGH
ncbi:MAG: nucleotidyltransferase [Pseudomonadota bacterium]